MYRRSNPDSDSDSDSGSDESRSTVAHPINPFAPGVRPSAVTRTYLSPPKLRRRGPLPPHTPARLTSYSPPWAPARPEGPAASLDGDEEEKLHIPTYGSAHAGDAHGLYMEKVHPSRVLHRRLNDMFAMLVRTKPAVNRAAKDAGLHLRSLQVVPWKELRSLDDPGEFLNALFEHYDDAEIAGDDNPFDKSRKNQVVTRMQNVQYFPQVERFLAREADASDALMTNCLNPVLAVVEQFLPLHYRTTLEGENKPVGPGLKIICCGQHPLPGAVDSSGKPSALDLTFALVSWPPKADPKLRFDLRFDLVICELKRPGYVQLDHWEGKNFHPKHGVHAWPAALLPQVMLYNHRSACERFIISDYLTNVAVHIEHESILDQKGHVAVGAEPITCDRGKPTSPYRGGVGTAIAYEIAQALKALGCADDRLFANSYHHNGQTHPIPLHPDIRNFLRAHEKI